jgi:YHS domain-containing protein
MPVDPARAAASGNTLIYQGATYYFCSRQCKQKFQNGSPRSASMRDQSGSMLPGGAGD